MTNLAEPMGIFATLRQRAASFAERHPSMARRIMGLRPLGIASKSHLIEIDLGKGTRTVRTLDGAPPPKRKPRKRKPVVVRPPPEPPPKAPVIVAARVYSIAKIVAVVCRCWEITEADFYSFSRPQRLGRPRFAAYVFCRDLTKLSLPQIGWQLGKKHHTTIMHGLKRAGDLHANDANWRARYDAAAAELQV